jgi:hypothetical protein
MCVSTAARTIVVCRKLMRSDYSAFNQFVHIRRQEILNAQPVDLSQKVPVLLFGPRVWSIYNRISPSRNFSPYVNNTWSRDYPFSVKPDRKLTTADVLHLFRDHYEGTVYDLTQGMAAGPYVNPYRNEGLFDQHKAFEPGESELPYPEG